jgi:hypothetical protein
MGEVGVGVGVAVSDEPLEHDATRSAAMTTDARERECSGDMERWIASRVPAGRAHAPCASSWRTAHPLRTGRKKPSNVFTSDVDELEELRSPVSASCQSDPAFVAGVQTP